MPLLHHPPRHIMRHSSHQQMLMLPWIYGSNTARHHRHFSIGSALAQMAQQQQRQPQPPIFQQAKKEGNNHNMGMLAENWEQSHRLWRAKRDELWRNHRLRYIPDAADEHQYGEEEEMWPEFQAPLPMRRQAKWPQQRAQSAPPPFTAQAVQGPLGRRPPQQRRIWQGMEQWDGNVHHQIMKQRPPQNYVSQMPPIPPLPRQQQQQHGGGMGWQGNSSRIQKPLGPQKYVAPPGLPSIPPKQRAKNMGQQGRGGGNQLVDHQMTTMMQTSPSPFPPPNYAMWPHRPPPPSLLFSTPLGPSLPPQDEIFWQHLAPRPQPNKLRDPQREFRMIRGEMRERLFEEYTTGGEGDGNNASLANVLGWAERMRRTGLDQTPLLDLIGRLQRQRRPALIPPLYKAFLRTPEAKPYFGRAELLFPAIAQAFQAANPLPKVASVCRLIRQLHSIINNGNNGLAEQPGQVALQNFLRSCFRLYVRDVSNPIGGFQQNDGDGQRAAIVALQIQEMASALRQSGCYPAPLAEAIDFAYSQNAKANWALARKYALHLYQAFIEEPTERKLFADRPHVHFPWMMEQIFGKNEPVLGDLFRMHTKSPLPDFLAARMFKKLHFLFDYAVNRGDFDMAQRIWNFAGNTKLRLQYHPSALLKLSLHNWANGRQLDARIIRERMNGQLKWLKWNAEEGDEVIKKFAGKQLEIWEKEQHRLAKMNERFRELMKNPQTDGQCRHKYSRIFHGWMRDFLREGGKIPPSRPFTREIEE